MDNPASAILSPVRLEIFQLPIQLPSPERLVVKRAKDFRAGMGSRAPIIKGAHRIGPATSKGSRSDHRIPSGCSQEVAVRRVTWRGRGGEGRGSCTRAPTIWPGVYFAIFIVASPQRFSSLTVTWQVAGIVSFMLELDDVHNIGCFSRRPCTV